MPRGRWPNPPKPKGPMAAQSRDCRLLEPQGRPLSFSVSLVLALPLSLTLVLALPLSCSVSLSLRLSVSPSLSI